MKIKPQTQSAPAAGRRPNRLVRRSPSPLALEQRFMFDGAAVTTAVDAVSKPTDTVAPDSAPHLLKLAATDTQAVPSDLVAAQAQAEKLVGDFLNRSDAKQQMFTLFNGGQTGTPSAAWDAAFTQLMSAFKNGDTPVRVELRSAAELQGAKGAFSLDGTTGQATIYLNADWLAGNPAAQIGAADSASITNVLVEELGHYLDAKLNNGGDTAGDEGEIFSRFVIDGTNPLSVSFLSTQDDHGMLTLDGQTVQAEFASFTFVNAYEMVYDQNNSSNSLGVVNGAIDTTERWADKEQNLHYFNSTVSLGQVQIIDGTNNQNFSGNDVSATSIIIGGNTYYGWISRPIKANGLVRGFYFWTDRDFTNFATAQADGNQDGDNSVLDNRGFLLVVDQAWFDTQITSTRVSETINNLKDGNLGTVAVANVGSSSDRVDSALNSLLVPNSPPLAANDTLTLSESSSPTTTSVSATNGLLSNDSDPNNDTLTITGYSVSGISGTPTIGSPFSITGVGSITISTDGSYSFTPDANYSGSVPPITYTVSDGHGGSATANLSITVTPVNHAPSAVNDSASTPEDTPISSTVLSNDSDPDGDPLTVSGFSIGGTPYTAGQTATIANVGTFALNANGTYTFTPAANYNGSVPVISYTISDGRGGSATATLSLSVSAVNDAPVAVADNANGASYATAAGCVLVNGVETDVSATTQTGNVLSNDTDPDITVVGGNTHEVIAVTSENGHSWSSGVVQGLYGTLTIAADGSYTYRIDPSNTTVQALTAAQSLTEYFTYTMREIGTSPALSATSTLRVDIHGMNDAPVANNDFNAINELASSTVTNGVTNYGTASGSLYATGVLGNDVDPDNATLSVGTVSISGAATADFASTSGSGTSLTLTFSGTPASLTTAYYVYWLDNGANDATPILLYSDAAHTTLLHPSSITGTGANLHATIGSATVYDASGTAHTLVNTDYIAFYNSTTPSITNAKYYEAQITAAPVSANSTTFNNVNVTSGSLALGETVTLTTGSTTTTGAITNIVYNPATGNITSFDVSSSTAFSSGSYTLTATKTEAAGTRIDGQYGYLDLASDGTYTYYLTSNALQANQVFNERFTYTATDGTCTDTAVLTIRLTGTNTQLADTSFTTLEDTSTGSRTVAVGGQTLSSYSFFNGTATVTGTVGTAQDLVLNGVTTGSLTLDSAGNYTFVPAANYSGPVPTITYVIADGAAATLSLHITPVNDAPDGTNKTVGLTDKQTYTFSVADFGFTDPNDQPANNFLSVTISTLPANGALSLNGSTISAGQVVTLADLNSGLLVFTPTENLASDTTASFTFQVKDDGGTANGGVNLDLVANTFTLNVSRVNDAPVNTLPTTVSTNSYTSVNFGSTISATDPDRLDATNNINTIVLNVGGGTLVLGGSASVNSGTGYTLSGNGTGTVTITATNDTETDLQAVLATLVYTPTSTFSGTDTLTMTTTDHGNLVDIDSVNITVAADNRTLTVQGTTVNEASPYVQFQVGGASDQWVKLTLGETGSGTGHATMGTDFLTSLQYFNGTAWVNYTGSPVQIPHGATTLLVRAPVLQDLVDERAETLKLTATNMANTAVSGTSTIIDDGTGSIFLGNNNTSTPNGPGDTDPNGPGYPTYLDDDRPVTVNHIAVNEGSPYAVLTVSGYPGQKISLAWVEGTAKKENGDSTLATDGTEDFGPALQYWDVSASRWVDYNGTSVTLAGTTLLVRTQINQDNVFEQQEAFNLAVTKLSSGTTSYGRVDIYDDGTGQWFDGNSGTGSNAAPTGHVLDDDRPTLSIADVSVEEGSHAVFNVSLSNPTSAPVVIKFALTSGTAGSSDYDTDLSHLVVSYSGGTLTPDAFGRYTVPAGITSLTVKVATTDDTTFEGQETFILSADVVDEAIRDTDTGTATIYDDGSVEGDDSNSIPDDDRTLAVNSISVNEGSPFGVFTVTANKGQTLTLSLVNGTAIDNAAHSTATDGSVDFGPVLEYSTDGGAHWSTYTAGFTVPGTGTGTVDILVRTVIINDAAYENAQDFTLSAAYTSGLARSNNGTATIHDDGTGQWFDGSGGTGANTAPNGHVLDDDRTLGVNNVDVNEGSPYAVFTVSGHAGQQIKLELQVTGNTPGISGSGGNATVGTDIGSTLEYSTDGGATWNQYTANGYLTLLSNTLLVRVAIVNDNLYEGAETFNLVATNASGGIATGTGTIHDDGTGAWFAGNGGTGTPTAPAGKMLDDDRAVPPPPPAPQPPVSAAPITVALPYGEVRVYIPEMPVLTTPPAEPIKELPSLAVVNQAPEQYADSGAKSSFALPKDTFVHSNPTETLLFSATLATGQKLPNWIRFDAESGTFEFQAPTDFVGELKIKVTARDSKGNEVSTVFRFNVGKKREIGRLPAGRASLSEQLFMAGREPSVALGRLDEKIAARVESRKVAVA